MQSSLSIIMPAFNEAESIKRALSETARTMKALGSDYEIIVVDDGSTDATRAIAESVAKKDKHVKVVGYATNIGKGFALKFGSRFFSKSLVSFFDADLDIPPRQIKVFLDTMRQTGADIVVGSKLHPKSKINYPFSRRVMSYFYNLLVRLLFQLDLKDTQTGLKLFRASALKKIMPRIAIKRFAFDLELLVIARKFGYSIVEAPIEIDYGCIGSTVNPLAILGIFVDTCAIFYRKNILHYYDKKGGSA